MLKQMHTVPRAITGAAPLSLHGLPRLAAVTTRSGPAPLHVFRNYGFEPEKARQTSGEGHSPLTFTDHRAVFEGRTTADLLRALLVLRLCTVPPFVNHSEGLLAAARRVLGEGTAMGMVKESFYRHFCAGKEPADVWGRMNALRAHGIGAILDYAEEEDLLPHCKQEAAKEKPKEAEKGKAAVSARSPLGGESLIESRVAARTYEYQGEEFCERHVSAFMAAIDTAATLPGQGFAAVKLTALGDPNVLEHLAASLEAVQGLFRRYDVNGDGLISREEFEAAFERLARKQGGSSSADEASAVWALLEEAGHGGRVDYVAWVSRLDLRALPTLAAGLQAELAAQGGAGASAGRPWALTAEEQVKLDALFGRLERLVERAVDKGVKLMIDGEQAAFRTAIDHVAHDLMRRHNAAPGGAAPGGASILLTYQAYLKDCPARLAADLARAQRGGYVLGAKLVRGAYLHLERRRAAEAGKPSPVCDSLAETHASFDTCLAALLDAAAAGRAELMVGTHSQSSVEAVVAGMAARGLDPEEAPVFFGQLLGMADNLSFTLGHHGYKVFKYCPYGSVDKCIPYLLRRVNENQYVLKGGKQDVAMLWAELWRRALHEGPAARLLGGGRDGAASASAV